MPPNILWLMTDEQRTDSLGCYGSPWAHTPHLDALAKDGIVFDNAVTPAPVCGPARASLTTGEYPSQLGIWWNVGQPWPELPHLTERFHAAGYKSASFGKRHYCAVNDAFQTEENIVLSNAVHYYHYAEGYDPAEYDVVQYPGKPYPWIFGGRFPLPAEHKQEARAVAMATAWLEEHDRANPFFLRLSFNAPHTPVVPPVPFDTLIKEDTIDLPKETNGPPPGQPDWIATSLRSAATSDCLSAEQIAKMRRYYYGECAFVDDQVGRLLDWMRKRGLLENTIIAYVSDHGTHLADYGLVQKQTFYEPAVKVPYLFWAPEHCARGKHFDTPVETRSLMPTLLELSGLDVPDEMKEVSLANALRNGKEPEARPVFSEFTLGSFEMRPDDKLVMVCDGPWKLSLCLAPDAGDGALHNLEQDPYERTNLFGQPEHAETQARLTRLIEAHLAT